MENSNHTNTPPPQPPLFSFSLNKGRGWGQRRPTLSFQNNLQVGDGMMPKILGFMHYYRQNCYINWTGKRILCDIDHISDHTT